MPSVKKLLTTQVQRSVWAFADLAAVGELLKIVPALLPQGRQTARLLNRELLIALLFPCPFFFSFGNPIKAVVIKIH